MREWGRGAQELSARAELGSENLPKKWVRGMVSDNVIRLFVSVEWHLLKLGFYPQEDRLGDRGPIPPNDYISKEWVGL